MAGSPKRDSGYCIINDGKTTTTILHSDDDILNAIKKNYPKIIGIDAPLSLPPGRKSIDDQNDVHFRSCDLELRNRGIRFFPITLGPMRMLTERGIHLKNRIEKMDIQVIEVYPGATFDRVGVPRKDHKAIRSLFQKYVTLDKDDYTQDELDSIACAITTEWFLTGEAIAIGGDDGQIIIPSQRLIKFIFYNQDIHCHPKREKGIFTGFFNHIILKLHEK